MHRIGWQILTDRLVAGAAPAGLLEAFWDYERALEANDLEVLDRLFAPGAESILGGADGILVGHDTISAFQNCRGMAPARTIGDLHVRDLGNDRALVVAVTLPATGGRGLQTQVWHRSSTNDGDADWLIEAAQVSVPAPAIEKSVWRIVGSPLVAGADDGPLVGETVAVKDLFDVAGFAVGAGVPAYLAESPRNVTNASAVTALLAAGASVQGIAQTDEFAYSIAGKNSQYGTPSNAAVPGAIPGGSSSGPATAVASGQVSIGLGTDTSGSIRVPASYQGLWGLRTTHDTVAREGLLALAPSFDTVGWLTRDAETLRAVASASLGNAGRQALTAGFAVAPALVALASTEVQDAFAAALAALAEAGLTDDLVEVTLPDADDLLEIFDDHAVAFVRIDLLMAPVGKGMRAGGGDLQIVLSGQFDHLPTNKRDLLARFLDRVADPGADFDDRLMHLGFDGLMQQHFTLLDDLGGDMRTQIPRDRIDGLVLFFDTYIEAGFHAMS